MTIGLLEAQGRRVKDASRVVARSSDANRQEVLRAVAANLRARADEILSVNEKDLTRYDGPDAGRDRLRLSNDRVAAMAQTLDDVASLGDPLGERLDATTRPNGLVVSKLRVPLGVVGVIYENRPNVTTDVAGLCVRSGNAAFLRGSASAQETNQFLVDLWRDALVDGGFPIDTVALVADTDHATAATFMGLRGIIDCLIPRGGPSLIAAMREHARVPYVLDGDGNCHVYVHADADCDMARAIVVNAKMSRPGVCNAAETVLVHRDIAATFLPLLERDLVGVELRANDEARQWLTRARPVSDEDFATEFLGPVLAVGVVGSFEEAVAHVERFGSGHSEAIVTTSNDAATKWINDVDAAAVVVNASTRFVDGSELGLGGEVGISTQKLHARGPMGLRELTCLKWVIEGKGQIR